MKIFTISYSPDSRLMRVVALITLVCFFMLSAGCVSTGRQKDGVLKVRKNKKYLSRTEGYIRASGDMLGHRSHQTVTLVISASTYWSSVLSWNNLIMDDSLSLLDKQTGYFEAAFRAKGYTLAPTIRAGSGYCNDCERMKAYPEWTFWGAGGKRMKPMGIYNSVVYEPREFKRNAESAGIIRTFFTQPDMSLEKPPQLDYRPLIRHVRSDLACFIQANEFISTTPKNMARAAANITIVLLDVVMVIGALFAGDAPNAIPTIPSPEKIGFNISCFDLLSGELVWQRLHDAPRFDAKQPGFAAKLLKAFPDAYRPLSDKCLSTDVKDVYKCPWTP